MSLQIKYDRLIGLEETPWCQVEESLDAADMSCEQRDQILAGLTSLASNLNGKAKNGKAIKEEERKKEERRNSHFAGLMDTTRMEVGPKRGRYIVATRDIPVSQLYRG